MSSYDQQYESVINSKINLNWLREREVYKKNEVEWFFKKEEGNWELSNMAGGMPIFFKGSRFHCTEQLYQASKYEAHIECAPENKASSQEYIKNVRARILATKNARGCKMTQKCAVKAGLVRDDWADQDFEVRIHSMLWVLELKLYYNRLDFGKILKQTGERKIVEISSKDSFWGCKEKDGVLDGRNVLSKLLMIVRERCDEIKKGDFSYPHGFLLD